jgi:hypothetical protein
MFNSHQLEWGFVVYWSVKLYEINEITRELEVEELDSPAVSAIDVRSADAKHLSQSSMGDQNL